MNNLFRKIYNDVYRSSHRFRDGSGMYYMIRYDIIRYYSAGHRRRIADIPTAYNQTRGKSRVDSSVVWRWRDPLVPLGDLSDSGPKLSESERSELRQKLRFFLSKQPKHFEPL
jgi:hypothetical protein